MMCDVEEKSKEILKNKLKKRDNSENVLALGSRRKGISKARSAVSECAQVKEMIGSFVNVLAQGNNVFDFYFKAKITGYEGWQWLATLFYDEAREQWTVDEVSLVPTDKALLAPEWISAKNNLTRDDENKKDEYRKNLRTYSRNPRRQQLSQRQYESIEVKIEEDEEVDTGRSSRYSRARYGDHVRYGDHKEEDLDDNYYSFNEDGIEV